MESSKFTEATSNTEFNFSYAYHNSYLFGKFLELSPIYMGASWFVQKYTLRKRVQRIVTLGEIIEDEKSTKLNRYPYTRMIRYTYLTNYETRTFLMITFVT